MKAFITYLCLLITGFAFSQSQGLETSSLIKNTYSLPTIEAFQERSEKKVEEFYEYLGLLTQQNLSKEVKREIEENIYLLFQHKNMKLINFISAKKERIQLEKLISILKNSEETKFTINNQTNTPVMGEYWLNYYTLQLEKTSSSTTLNVQQPIFLAPKQKEFGQQKKEVWELVLGEVSMK